MIEERNVRMFFCESIAAIGSRECFIMIYRYLIVTPPLLLYIVWYTTLLCLVYYFTLFGILLYIVWYTTLHCLVYYSTLFGILLYIVWYTTRPPCILLVPAVVLPLSK